MKKLIVFFAGILAVSCGLNSKPEIMLPREKMVDLMYDLTLYNSMQSYNFNTDTVYIYHKRKDILQKYGIDSVQFESLHEYYRKDVKDYSAIHKEVQDKILAKIEEVKALPNNEEDERDFATQKSPISKRLLQNISSTNVESVPMSEKTD